MPVNELGISFSTINGSGSATANNTILKAIFKMGIPVAARNIFPSNIQGMPTCYQLRINEKGFKGRLEENDIVIAMNPEMVDHDIQSIKTGGLLLVNSTISYEKPSRKMKVVEMPVLGILEKCDTPQHLNIYLANMVYVGVLAYLIGIDIEKIEIALNQHFNGMRSAVDPNLTVVKSAFDWAASNLKKSMKNHLKALDLNRNQIMIDGNTAGALGALYGGLQFAAWYPITPATSLAESLNEYIPRLRTDPETGATTCVVVQAEDELAAIGMVIGAGWAGLRSMTSTSGPGLCLMSEFLGLAYYAEVPVVVWDVQRVGPSTGLPTHTSQGDLSFSYFLSHGDKDVIILIPAHVGECFEFGWKALDIAEQYQAPVVILSDLELGMNIWMTDEFSYPDEKIERGKVLWEEDLQKIISDGKQTWGRYKDIDGDGIPYRTVPGNLHEKAAYFTRGTGHDEYALYCEDAEIWENNLDRLKKKIRSSREKLPNPEIHKQADSITGMISYGSSDMPVIESQALLNEKGMAVDYMRIRAIPFHPDVDEFLASHEQIYIVEANRDGQMKNLLCINYPQYASKFVSIAKCDGLSLSAKWISSEILKTVKKGIVNA